MKPNITNNFYLHFFFLQQNIMAVKVAARKAVRKATKPMAPKRVARKAKKITKKSQTGSMRQVWNGTRTYTKGGLTKASLMMNKRGKVVSKKASAKAKKNGGITKWCAAMKKARKELGITGFVKINRGAQGVALYKLAKKYHC